MEDTKSRNLELCFPYFLPLERHFEETWKVGIELAATGWIDMLGGKGEWAVVAWQPAVWAATQPNLCAVSRGGGGGGGGKGGGGGMSVGTVVLASAVARYKHGWGSSLTLHQTHEFKHYKPIKKNV